MYDFFPAVGGQDPERQPDSPVDAVARVAARPAPIATLRRRRGVALLITALLALCVGAAVGSAAGAGAGPRRADGRQRIAASDRARRRAHAPSLSLAGIAPVAERGIDRALARFSYVRVAGAQHREVALTFDDGPGPYTPAVVAELSRLHVPATFFEVGSLERWFSPATAAIAAHGWTIGDHTETHPLMSVLSRRDQRAELLEDAGALRAHGAPFPRLYRPPYGAWNAATLALLHHYRMLMVLWTVDTSDYLLPGVRAIVHRAVAGARPGAIILLHDGGGDREQTVRALPLIVRALRARGYRLVTVPRLLFDNPPPRDQVVTAPGGGD
jgi:peptidoglycan/xylan/chitin deacetylase (PgdA/CDA1 family)